MVKKGWRTFTFNGLAAVAVAGLAYLSAHGTEIVPPQYWPFVALGITAANSLLRSVTTTPPGKSS